MMQAIKISRNEVEDDVSEKLRFVKEMYLKKYKHLEDVNMKIRRDKEILQLTTHKLTYTNSELRTTRKHYELSYKKRPSWPHCWSKRTSR